MASEKSAAQKQSNAIIAGLVALFVIFSGIIGVYLYRFNSTLTGESQSRLREVTTYVSAHMTRVVKSTQETLNAASLAVGMLDTEQKRIEYLKKAANEFSFAYMGYSGEEGELHTTEPFLTEDVSKEDYFAAALKGESVVSGFKRVVFEKGIASGILLSVPLTMEDTGERGVLVAMLEVAQLSSVLEMENFDGEGYSYVFDSSGTIITRTKSLDFNNMFMAWQSFELDNGYSYQKFRDDVLNGVTGYSVFTNAGTKQYACYMPLTFNDWTVVTIVSEKALAAHINTLIKEMLIAGGVVVLVFGITLLAALRSHSISEKNKRRLASAMLEAQHDALTNLLNKKAMADLVAQVLKNQFRNRAYFLFIDVDNFKLVNDTFGHPMGDALLRHMGNSLNAIAAEHGIAGRVGGDEFLLVLSTTGDKSAEQYAGEVCTIFDSQTELDLHGLQISCSVGISVYPSDGGDYQTLVHKADKALYDAKRFGKNCFAFYTADGNETTEGEEKKAD